MYRCGYLSVVNVFRADKLSPGKNPNALFTRLRERVAAGSIFLPPPVRLFFRGEGLISVTRSCAPGACKIRFWKWGGPNVCKYIYCRVDAASEFRTI